MGILKTAAGVALGILVVIGLLLGVDRFRAHRADVAAREAESQERIAAVSRLELVGVNVLNQQVRGVIRNASRFTYRDATLRIQMLSRAAEPTEELAIPLPVIYANADTGFEVPLALASSSMAKLVRIDVGK